MATVAAPKSEKEWQAESDAQTLAEGAAIQADKKRFGRASKAAQKLSKEAQVKATALKRVATRRKSSKR